MHVGRSELKPECLQRGSLLQVHQWQSVGGGDDLQSARDAASAGDVPGLGHHDALRWRELYMARYHVWRRGVRWRLRGLVGGHQCAGWWWHALFGG